MEDGTRIWEVACRQCELTVGRLVGGRFIHDTSCPLPQRIAGGALRCCRCGGAVHPEEISVADALEIDRGRVGRRR